jgi:hypothetical protein
MPLAFQAVLLASDTGSRLYPLNSPATPKALLPIGNKAMLSFPLAMLEAGGVADVLIVRLLALLFCSWPQRDTGNICLVQEQSSVASCRPVIQLFTHTSHSCAYDGVIGPLLHR